MQDGMLTRRADGRIAVFVRRLVTETLAEGASLGIRPCHGSVWRFSLLTLISSGRGSPHGLPAQSKQRGSLPGCIADAIDRVAALGAGLIGTDLADAIEDLDFDALLGKAGEEPANGVRHPTHRLSDLRSAGT